MVETKSVGVERRLDVLFEGPIGNRQARFLAIVSIDAKLKLPDS